MVPLGESLKASPCKTVFPKTRCAGKEAGIFVCSGPEAHLNVVPDPWALCFSPCPMLPPEIESACNNPSMLKKRERSIRGNKGNFCVSLWTDHRKNLT